ncbi:MAG: hypothetical protein DRP35_09185, partial [Candidatus Zixiibacteriota bacterium]
MKSFLIVLIFFLATNINSSSLGTKLQKTLSDVDDQEKIHVWIKLPDAVESKVLKKTTISSSKSFGDSYRYGVSKLKALHAQSQKNIYKDLKSLTKQRKVSNIKQHWLVNVIEAEMTKEEIYLFSLRSDVEEIIMPIKPALITPISSSISNLEIFTADSVLNSLKIIKAPEAWAAGFTGKGRIVCSFDTGVEGSHPALASKWKGLDGDSTAAWFDPKNNEPFPHSFNSNDANNPSKFDINHGTHTMGTMVGFDSLNSVAIGVAPEANWISAGVVDIATVSLIDAFEWASNPDGDLNSVGDIPDVINHSWAVPDVGCEDLYYSMIDNVEALGIVNIFAAGNEGPSVTSMRNPGNRALDSLDCFAIGSINPADSLIASSSSRGPSDCNGGIKPNVIASGINIYSSVINGGFGIKGGTSMAAPHVSGLVALLREKNPNATVDQIKTAILTSTQNFGAPLPNNNYGWGLVDCKAALDALSDINTTPNLRVYKFDKNDVQPGDTVRGSLVLQNLGSAVSLVSVSVSGSNPLLNVLDGSSMSFGSLNENDTIRTSDSLIIEISSSAQPGTILTFEIDIAGTGYQTSSVLYIPIAPNVERTFVTHNTGNIQFSLSNYGMFGFDTDSYWPIGGEGFKYKNDPNSLWEGGIMMAINNNQVSDIVHNITCDTDNDFSVSSGGNIALINDGQVADEETISIFNDSRMVNSGIEITQRSYAFTDAENDDYIILKYNLTNKSSSYVNDVYFGLYMDWDITDFANNAGGYNSDGNYLWMAYHINDSVMINYRGIMILNGNPSSLNTQSILIPDCEGDGFTVNEKISTLKSGRSSDLIYANAFDDLNQTAAVGPIRFGANDEYTAVFALLAGDDSTALAQAALAAKTKYESNNILTEINDDSDKLIPKSFNLSQNYPNPFNPTTTISFSLPVKSNVEIEIFNLLGQSVKKLINKSISPGSYEIEWDGTNKQGKSVSTGIYLYRLKTEDFIQSK